MKKASIQLILLVLITACSAPNSKIESNTQELNTTSPNVRDTTQQIELSRKADICDFIYDTISNEKYTMHLAILDKCQDKEKRGYFFKAGGDTLNHFLYHQDIAKDVGET
jgi:hypothetical protein